MVLYAEAENELFVYCPAVHVQINFSKVHDVRSFKKIVLTSSITSETSSVVFICFLDPRRKDIF